MRGDNEISMTVMDRETITKDDIIGIGVYNLDRIFMTGHEQG